MMVKKTTLKVKYVLFMLVLILVVFIIKSIGVAGLSHLGEDDSPTGKSRRDGETTRASENIRSSKNRSKLNSLASKPLQKSLSLWYEYGEEGRSASDARSMRDSLVGALVQYGYTPAEVYNLIDETYEAGNNKNALIARLFDYLSPEQASELFAKLSIDERPAALLSMVSPLLGRKDIPEYLKSLQLTNSEADLFYKKFLGGYYMFLYRHQSVAKKEALLEVMKLPANDSIKKNFFLQALKDDPFDVYEAAVTDSSLFDLGASNLVSAMLAKDPERARDTVLRTPSITSELKLVAAHMLEAENASFVKWYDENKTKLKGEQVDYIEAGISKYLSDNNKIQDAWDQLDQITDPIIKKKAEGQIWAKERNMVQNAVKAEPQKALEELVSGTSVHDSYWIEEAMDVWLKKDFEAAEQWYQQNWKTLPKEKAQYAAASFARQAIQAGDIDAALQWMPYIQDVKTKARIEAQLEKVQKLQ